MGEQREGAVLETPEGIQGPRYSAPTADTFGFSPSQKGAAQKTLGGRRAQLSLRIFLSIFVSVSVSVWLSPSLPPLLELSASGTPTTHEPSSLSNGR